VDITANRPAAVDVIVDGNVDVDLIGSVIVAVHVSGNDTLIVIDPRRSSADLSPPQQRQPVTLAAMIVARGSDVGAV
jgi:hypothetical protein